MSQPPPPDTKRLTRPCRECPFRRDPHPAAYGQADPLALVGQAFAPFVLPCHTDPNYAGKGTDCSGVQQCAGAAIFRANVGVPVPPAGPIHTLPADPGGVYATPAELVAGYGRLPPAVAELLLAALPPERLAAVELGRPEVIRLRREPT